jgi:hypothetical protein
MKRALLRIGSALCIVAALGLLFYAMSAGESYVIILAIAGALVGVFLSGALWSIGDSDA